MVRVVVRLVVWLVVWVCECDGPGYASPPPPGTHRGLVGVRCGAPDVPRAVEEVGPPPHVVRDEVQIGGRRPGYWDRNGEEQPPPPPPPPD